MIGFLWLVGTLLFEVKIKFPNTFINFCKKQKQIIEIWEFLSITIVFENIYFSYFVMIQKWIIVDTWNFYRMFILFHMDHSINNKILWLICELFIIWNISDIISVFSVIVDKKKCLISPLRHLIISYVFLNQKNL